MLGMPYYPPVCVTVGPEVRHTAAWTRPRQPMLGMLGMLGMCGSGGHTCRVLRQTTEPSCKYQFGLYFYKPIHQLRLEIQPLLQLLLQTFQQELTKQAISYDSKD